MLSKTADGLQDIERSVKYIPTFDGAEFSGEKPKSDETLLKMMEMVGVPHDRRASILKKMKNSYNLIDKATLDSKQDGCCSPIRHVKSLKPLKDMCVQEKT